MADPSRPLAEHIGELRRRALISAASVLFCSLASLPIVPSALEALIDPLLSSVPGGRAVALTPFEAWSVYFKVAAAMGLVLSSPVWISQIVLFWRPAMNKAASAVFAACAAAAALFAAGAAFCYAAVLPAASRWGVSLARAAGAETIPRLSDCASIAMAAMAAFGLAFELPFALAAAAWLGIIDRETISKMRPYAIVSAFVLGALLTPPDVLSQVALAVPLYLLFEVGAAAGLLLARKKRDCRPVPPLV